MVLYLRWVMHLVLLLRLPGCSGGAADQAASSAPGWRHQRGALVAGCADLGVLRNSSLAAAQTACLAYHGSGGACVAVTYNASRGAASANATAHGVTFHPGLPRIGGQKRFSAPGKTMSSDVLSIETGCADTVQFPTRTKHPRPDSAHSVRLERHFLPPNAGTQVLPEISARASHRHRRVVDLHASAAPVAAALLPAESVPRPRIAGGARDVVQRHAAAVRAPRRHAFAHEHRRKDRGTGRQVRPPPLSSPCRAPVSRWGASAMVSAPCALGPVIHGHR